MDSHFHAYIDIASSGFSESKWCFFSGVQSGWAYSCAVERLQNVSSKSRRGKWQRSER